MKKIKLMELNVCEDSLIHVLTLKALRGECKVVRKDSNSLVTKVDDGVFTSLVCEHQDELYRIAYCYMRNKEEALDIVGDTIYKAYSNMKKLKKKEFFKTWIVRILINTANTVLKRRERERALIQFIIPKSKEKDRELEMDLKIAIERLDKRSKNIIILKYFNDYTTKTIAEILDCPEGTIKSNLNRTLNKLKITLKDEDFGNKGGELSYERSN